MQDNPDKVKLLLLPNDAHRVGTRAFGATSSVSRRCATLGCSRMTRAGMPLPSLLQMASIFQLYQGSQALIQTEDLPALRTPDAPHLEEGRCCDVVARHSGYHILDQFDSLRN